MSRPDQQRKKAKRDTEYCLSSYGGVACGCGGGVGVLAARG